MADRLDVLLGVADELGIQVRRASLGGEGGGLCILRGQRVLFVDIQAAVATQYETTLEALARLDQIDQLYIVPEIREDMDRLRSQP